MHHYEFIRNKSLTAGTLV